MHPGLTEQSRDHPASEAPSLPGSPQGCVRLSCLQRANTAPGESAREGVPRLPPAKAVSQMAAQGGGSEEALALGAAA